MQCVHDYMNQTQNEVTEMDSSAHVKDTAIKVDATSTAEAEDVDAAQPEASARLTEGDAIATRIGVASTQEERMKRAQKVTKKRPASQTWWDDQTAIAIES